LRVRHSTRLLFVGGDVRGHGMGVAAGDRAGCGDAGAGRRGGLRAGCAEMTRADATTGRCRLEAEGGGDGLSTPTGGTRACRQRLTVRTVKGPSLIHLSLVGRGPRGGDPRRGPRSHTRPSSRRFTVILHVRAKGVHWRERASRRRARTYFRHRRKGTVHGFVILRRIDPVSDGRRGSRPGSTSPWRMGERRGGPLPGRG